MIERNHEDIIKDQIRLAKLWLDVCSEQEGNGYNWELTKKKLLSDWRNENMTVDFWSAYMETTFVQFSIEHYYVDLENKKNTE
jgi:hypothetical protein